jgi:tRNA(Arg) A34 adenosine deaminase TadA
MKGDRSPVLSGDDRALEAAIDVVRRQWSSPHSGIVGAAALLADGDLIAAASKIAGPGAFSHAEAQLLRRVEAMGKLPDLPVARMATTLSPCLAGSRSRRGGACAERLVACNVREIYVGHIDPKQPPLDEYRRIGLRVVLTGNDRLRIICSRLAEIFEIYGEGVNTDIGRIKESVGDGIFVV